MSTSDITDTLSAIQADLKSLKRMMRVVRDHQKDPTGEIRAARLANNGFNRPQVVTPDLAKFLSLSKDETISRSQVSRRVNEYITANNLKNPDNGRHIILDKKLTAILAPPADTPVTFLNLQKFLSKHYVKVEAVVVPTPTKKAAVPKVRRTKKVATTSA